MREELFEGIQKWGHQTKGPRQSYAFAVSKNRSANVGGPSEMDQKGAQFRDPYTDMCWEILTVVEGMCSAREKRNGIFSSWTLDELHGHSVRPVRTMWEHLDDDTV